MAISVIAVPWQTFLFFSLILLPQCLNIYRELLDIIDIYFETEDHQLLKRKINHGVCVVQFGMKFHHIAFPIQLVI